MGSNMSSTIALSALTLTLAAGATPAAASTAKLAPVKVAALDGAVAKQATPPMRVAYEDHDHVHNSAARAAADLSGSFNV